MWMSLLNIIAAAGSAVLFAAALLGLGWPLARRLPLAGNEKTCASILLGYGILYLLAQVICWTGPPAWFYKLIPVLALGWLAWERKPLAEHLRDEKTRETGLFFFLTAGWCLGFLALIKVYSGGFWEWDWVEHYERALFFLEHWPRNTIFIERYTLPARPPLTNLVTAAFLGMTDSGFARFQVFTTLASVTVLLPGLLLVESFQGGKTARRLFVLLLFVNPLFLQNATYAWTKLHGAFFVLCAFYFFIEGWRRDSLIHRVLAFVSLSLGMLAHYSTGPYLAVLTAAYFLIFGRRRNARFWRETAFHAGLNALLLMTWFGWAAAAYGIEGTFLSNTTVTGSASLSFIEHVRMFFFNLAGTVWPFPLSFMSGALLPQNPLPFIRDYVFTLCQTNLAASFGSVSFFLLLYLWARGRRETGGQSRRERIFWGGSALGIIVLGIAAHPMPGWTGLAHICLQPLTILGLVFLAARRRRLPRAFIALWTAGLAADFFLGAGLHFYLQNQDLWPPVPAPQTQAEKIRWARHVHGHFSSSYLSNLNIKVRRQLDFFGDDLRLPPAALTLWLAFVWLLLVKPWLAGRDRRARPASDP